MLYEVITGAAIEFAGALAFHTAMAAALPAAHYMMAKPGIDHAQSQGYGWNNWQTYAYGFGSWGINVGAAAASAGAGVAIAGAYQGIGVFAGAALGAYAGAGMGAITRNNFV